MAIMAEKEDLGLSLSLGVTYNTFQSPSPSPPPMPKPQWMEMDLFSSSLVERGTEEERPLLSLRGIDVNRAPTAAAADEEETGVSSPNSTVSSVSGKRGHSETDRGFGGGSDEEDGGEACRKKLRLSKEQSAVLEESFKEHSTLNPKQKMGLAKKLNLRPRQVEVWFQNRRARTKLKQTEVDCEFLKRCCENLTDENRRLQKEVQELRALKLSPQLFMQMNPPTTLTMCPSCERVAAVPNTTTTTTDGLSNNRNSNVAITSQSPQHHHPFFQHRPVGPVLPWAPIPMRTAKFFDAPPQQS